MTIAEKLLRGKTDLDEVYAAGYEKGKSEGGNTEGAYNEGFEAGKKAEYDAFWDAYQKNGTRTEYATAFAGVGWNVDNFKPKYDIKPTGLGSAPAYMMFRENQMQIDLADHLDKLGVVLDFSGITGYLQYTFQNSRFTRVGRIDASNATNLSSTFTNAKYLVTIDALIVNENLKYSNAFSECYALENLIIEGIIGQNGLNFQHSTKLSKASIESIVTHLSETASGMSITFSKTAINKAFETSTGANDGFTNQSSSWYTLIATRPNWTFNYGT